MDTEAAGKPIDAKLLETYLADDVRYRDDPEFGDPDIAPLITDSFAPSGSLNPKNDVRYRAGLVTSKSAHTHHASTSFSVSSETGCYNNYDHNINQPAADLNALQSSGHGSSWQSGSPKRLHRKRRYPSDPHSRESAAFEPSVPLNNKRPYHDSQPCPPHDNLDVEQHSGSHDHHHSRGGNSYVHNRLTGKDAKLAVPCMMCLQNI